MLDKNLDFKKHVNVLCKKAGQTLHALACISNYMDTEKLKIMIITSVISQFSYCRLVWMFHDRSVDKKINKIHERALRIAYKDSCSTFDDLLKKAKSVSIYQRNLQLLATESFKTHSNLNPSLMKKSLSSKMYHTPFVVAILFWHQNQKRQGMALKMHDFLDLGCGMQCQLL